MNLEPYALRNHGRLKTIRGVFVILLIVATALACGGGGGGGSSVGQSTGPQGDVTRFSYRFKPSELLPIKAGMTLTVRELASGSEVLVENLALDSVGSATVTLNFHIDKNYVFAVDLHGMPFMRTTIVSSQIRQATTDKVLWVGVINPITTYITGLLEEQLAGGRYLSKARFAGNVSSGNTLVTNATELLIHDVLAQNFSGNVTNLSSLSYVNFESGSVQTTALFHQRKNRINLMRLYINTASALTSVTAGQSSAMRALFNAFFDETNAANLLSKLTDPNLPNLDSAGDQGVSLMAELAARDASQNFLFLSGNGVLSPDQLRQVFFTPLQAYDSLLMQITLSTTESIISGVISGPGAVGAQVVLRTAAGNSQATTTSGSDGHFVFSQIPTGSYVLKVSSLGFVYTGSLGGTQVVSANLQNIAVSVQSSNLSTHLNPSELEWTGTQLRVKQGGVTSSHLASSLSLSGNLSVDTLKVGEVSFPPAGGNSAQILQLTSSNQLGWAGLPAGFNGNYQNLLGRPTLFSGNYGDLVGAPMSANVPQRITADWDNSAQPWTDTEVSDQLTLSSSNLSGVEISMSSANLSALTVIGSANLAGRMWPNTKGSKGQLLSTQGNSHLGWETHGGLPSLSASQVVIGNASGVPTAVSLSGNASLTEAGVLSLSANSIASAQVQDGSLTTSDFTASLVHSGNLSAANLQVSSAANMAGLYIPSTKGTSGQVLKISATNTLTWGTDLTTGAIAANTVTTLHLADASVGSAQLASASVSGNHVQDGSLSAAEFSSSLSLAGNAQTAGNLVVVGSSNLGGLLLPSGTGSANQVLISAGNGSLQWKTVDASLLGTGTVTAQALADGSVSTTQIFDAGITAADISANAITSAKISAGAISAAHIAAYAVDSAALADNILVNTLGVAGNVSLGSSSADNIFVYATLTGATGSSNISVGGNLVPSLSGLSLGSSGQPFAGIYSQGIAAANVKSSSSPLGLDVNSDAVSDLTVLSTGNVGLGTSTPAARLHLSGNMKVSGLWQGSVTTVSANATLGTAETTLVDTSSANIILTLPAASTLTGRVLKIKKINRDQGYVRVSAADNIDGVGSVFLKNSAGVLPSIEVLSNGSTWHIFERTGGTTEPQGGYMLVDVSGGPTASFYPVSYTNVTPDLTGSGNFTFKSNVIVLKWIPPGVFTMGNTTASVTPEHEVTITEGFWAGVFEVTQLQWLQVMGAYPTGSQDYNNSGTNTDPMHQVSWEDIRGSSATSNWPNTTAVGGGTFMGNLQAKTGLNFDLPTEAEWEYTCRAGTTTQWSFGDTENGDYMWYTTNNTPTGTKEVGGKLPNPWGLYDMHGNLFEWCLDWRNPSYPSYESPSVQADPLGALSGSARLDRGGYWDSIATGARSARRLTSPTGYRHGSQGFRLYSRPW